MKYKRFKISLLIFTMLSFVAWQCSISPITDETRTHHNALQTNIDPLYCNLDCTGAVESPAGNIDHDSGSVTSSQDMASWTIEITPTTMTYDATCPNTEVKGKFYIIIKDEFGNPRPKMSTKIDMFGANFDKSGFKITPYPCTDDCGVAIIDIIGYSSKYWGVEKAVFFRVWSGGLTLVDDIVFKVKTMDEPTDNCPCPGYCDGGNTNSN